MKQCQKCRKVFENNLDICPFDVEELKDLETKPREKFHHGYTLIFGMIAGFILALLVGFVMFVAIFWLIK